MLKFLDEYRDKDACLEIADRIKSISKKKINIMEVCGGHTMAIRKNGINKIVGKNVDLISGPGCPVCVSAIEDIDDVITLSKMPGVVICTFGDLFYVPGTESSLAKEKANGADVRIVYSVKDAVEFAKDEKTENFVFISIGFETTAPTSAAAIIEASEFGINNFFIVSLNKTLPSALKALLSDKNSKVDALICPGHVSTITGPDMYKFIVEELGIPCCISGFEPTDLLTSIFMLVEMCENSLPRLANAYERAVHRQGNEKAKIIMKEVFKDEDAIWRGLGTIPDSGLGLKPRYKRFDARENFNIKKTGAKENPACICGEILRGSKKPTECSLFRRSCRPDDPKGACMVSSEGSCAAVFKYGD